MDINWEGQNEYEIQYKNEYKKREQDCDCDLTFLIATDNKQSNDHGRFIPRFVDLKGWGSLI